MESYLNLIRGIAWSFHHTSGIAWEDLFGEAILAYFEAMESFNPDKSKESTWIWYCVRNHLINFCKKESRHNNIPRVDELDWNRISYTPNYEFFIHEDIKWIIRMVLRNQERYLDLGSRQMLGQIRRDLREKRKWKHQRIWDAMRNLKLELNQSG